ncbi:MAG: rhomboid family intramembrane serine protease [Bacteroidota bacterium]|jgi:membrane associated rhomboid family serine protease|nr:rhomboid family intramembrane serine protease [Ignavibacteria bacterium]MCU7500732.1 rhomboid family intramembrane serine protease [Ignavibacteria bacterium]MCU7514562.1 rhomboid family intramembrane serine protease [Ignavibacteria bacterium]MCU7520873.1 rhomboid family intramembrane serine protease [Ignavibacteria bacterium]MCU7526452.1 rhomboid family intramembrane serine protease [Ignavibacteria bacterium]
MIFPIGDDNTDRTMFPLTNYLIILLNVFVFVFLQGLGSNIKFTYAYSTVPAEIVTGKDIITEDRVMVDPETDERVEVPGLQKTPINVYLTIFTSMFMHGGIAHIFGNMIFLWVFGDNIENKLGHMRYLIFYLVCGALSSLSQVTATIMFNGNPYVPTLGASGAISGVLGGYMLLYPRRRVRVVLFYILTVVPAIVAIGMWFAFQVIAGLGGLGSQGGGVAYAAHVGGFIAGFILIKIFAIGRP